MAGRPSLEDEFTAFVATVSPRLYRKALLLTTSAPAAEDLVQSALAKSFVHWRRVSAADDVTAYVHGIVLKTFLTERRRRSSSELPMGDLPDQSAYDTDPALRLTLLAALRLLGRTDRAVVVLRYWEDRSVAETAHALHLSPAAVKNRSMRALAALRTHLSELDELDPISKASR